jgi:hypothetical protein
MRLGRLWWLFGLVSSLLFVIMLVGLLVVVGVPKGVLDLVLSVVVLRGDRFSAVMAIA